MCSFLNVQIFFFIPFQGFKGTAIVLARVSTEQQISGGSLQNQRDYLVRVCKSRKLKVIKVAKILFLSPDFDYRVHIAVLVLFLSFLNRFIFFAICFKDVWNSIRAKMRIENRKSKINMIFYKVFSIAESGWRKQRPLFDKFIDFVLFQPFIVLYICNDFWIDSILRCSLLYLVRNF